MVSELVAAVRSCVRLGKLFWRDAGRVGSTQVGMESFYLMVAKCVSSLVLESAMCTQTLVTSGDVEHEATISNKPFITTNLVVTDIKIRNVDPMDGVLLIVNIL